MVLTTLPSFVDLHADELCSLDAPEIGFLGKGDWRMV